ncbi:MAG: Nif3-like dinuclear metal center hexameric protein [Bacteroidota bacterium]
MKIQEIISFLETIAPLSFQESYDNSGLACGDKNAEIKNLLICLDVNENVVEEAVRKKCNLIISHHPVIFSPLKKIVPENYPGNILYKAIQNNIVLYSLHTNFDSIRNGINYSICEKLGLKNIRVLSPKQGILKKLVTFCPEKEIEKVRKALFDAGAGHIGQYDECSYNLKGTGTFRASTGANPFVGKIGKRHNEEETRFETIYPDYLEKKIIQALIQSHPYEEVAYDIYALDNKYKEAGSGLIGEFEKGIDQKKFLLTIKSVLKIPYIRISGGSGKKVQTVSVCSGSGAFLLHASILNKADAFITSDAKYHSFQEAGKRLLLVDTGHYETEIFFKDIIYNLLIKKFTTFALHKSKTDLNPVIYS